MGDITRCLLKTAKAQPWLGFEIGEKRYILEHKDPPEVHVFVFCAMRCYFIDVVGSLDKHIQNEKELIRPRRLCLRRELPCSKVVQFRLRRELPVPGTKG